MWNNSSPAPQRLLADGTANHATPVFGPRSANQSSEGTSTPGAQSVWLVWQLADSAFPTGGFAHSGGLEAAWRHGEVRNGVELESFVDSSLRQFCHGSLPFMIASHHELGRVLDLDLLCESFLLNHVANRASRAQGRALLASAERIFTLPPWQASEQRPPYCHLAPVFGFVMRSLDVKFTAACRLFLFLQLRGLFASAVRLGIVGPLEAQTLQHRFAPRAEQMLDQDKSISIEEIAQTSPLLEIWQASHDRLYSRLFQS
jgi:urease accessory protein